MITSNELRQTYLEFFKKRGHAVLPSAPLVPENDPTVLFTTAGMHPLVPYLMGEGHPQGNRLTSSQKCLRTNDIDEVGDNRHLTFFEMLGNWSLGDYFKDQSIRWSWELLTSKTEGLGLDPSRIYVTVFAGDEDAPRDEESIGVWKECYLGVGIQAGVDAAIAEGGRIFTRPKEDNWWGPAGQTGPCGPDTEIYYDMGEGSGVLTLEDGMPDLESGRLVEVWNNVFMQYNKQADGSFKPLGQNNVDTGMGFERMLMILQDVPTVFETDLFVPLTALIREMAPDNLDSHSVRVVADHIRSSVMLIGDGVRPSNKDRGYILRRLIRRAALHSGIEGTGWVAPLVERVLTVYAQAYPDLRTIQGPITQSLTEEVEKFQRTLRKGQAEIEKRERLSGKDAFDLYQSYGFPLELTKEYAASKGIAFDEAEFEAEFRKHQELSRTASAGQFSSGLADHSEMTVRYHTATHLLHQALKDVLGDQVQQRGSNLNAERLRFDFSYPEKMTPEQIQSVEEKVNTEIAANHPVSVDTMSPEQAQERGAIGLFGHKYGETVTVYTIGNYSKEICTGPHVQNTNELGVFKIKKEEAVSAGVRRIKAVLETR